MHERQQSVSQYVRMYACQQIYLHITLHTHTTYRTLRVLSVVKLTGLPTEKDDVEDVFLISTAGRKHKQLKMGTVPQA